MATIPPVSKRSIIAAGIRDLLIASDYFNYVSVDNVKLESSDFSPQEFPAVQLIDMATTSTNEKARVQQDWMLGLEIVISENGEYSPTQSDLFDLLQATERVLFQESALTSGYGLNEGFITTRLLQSYTDLHILKPYYSARLELVISYYQPLVRDCC